jgi:hypothetical protein
VVREHDVRSTKPKQNSFGFVSTGRDHYEASYILLQDEAAACVLAEARPFQTVRLMRPSDTSCSRGTQWT